MSDKITKTVTFEIEPSGDCGKCEAKERLSNYCNAFRVGINTVVENADGYLSLKPSQCQACKDYLAEQKSRVYCDGCKHVAYIKSGFCAGTLSGTSHYICTIKNNQIITQPSSCQDRSE